MTKLRGFNYRQAMLTLRPVLAAKLARQADITGERRGGKKSKVDIFNFTSKASYARWRDRKVDAVPTLFDLEPKTADLDHHGSPTP